MLIFRVFTDAGCGGIRYPEVSDYRPQPLGYSYRCAFPCFARLLGRWAVLSQGYRCAKPLVIHIAALSRASHDCWGGGRFYPGGIAALNPRSL